MKFYFVDDDRNILTILKLIITDLELGTVCGAASNGEDALTDIRLQKPDIVIADLLMPEMDGITFIGRAKQLLPNAAFIMLSQVSSKDMIASAYEAGVEFFIQKPVNSVEVEMVIQKVKKSLSMQRTLYKMQSLFRDEVSPFAPTDSSNSYNFKESLISLKGILQKLGIIGDIGSKDILQVVEYLLNHPDAMNDITLNELCSRFSDSPKSMEQRIRRTALTGLVNLAHLGIEDYGNDIFTDYASTLYNFEQVKREMDFIRGKSDRHGNVKIKNFIQALVVYSSNL